MFYCASLDRAEKKSGKKANSTDFNQIPIRTVKCMDAWSFCMIYMTSLHFNIMCCGLWNIPSVQCTYDTF